jgi:hypothetical protein
MPNRLHTTLFNQSTGNKFITNLRSNNYGSKPADGYKIMTIPGFTKWADERPHISERYGASLHKQSSGAMELHL